MIYLTISNNIRLEPVSSIHKDIVIALKAQFTFVNSQYNPIKKRAVKTVIRKYKEYKNCLVLPRGGINHVIDILKMSDIPYRLIDKRRKLPEYDFKFYGKLWDYQEPLVEKSLNRQFGTICAVTGGGKTVMGNYIISQRKQPTLVMVRTERLARQWVEEVEKFLGVPKEQVGFIGDGRVDIAPHITIGIIPTLFKNVDKIKHHFGFVICDEVHRIVARTFAEVIGKLDTKFMLGLSATFKRRDGLHPLIHWYIGDMVASVSRDEVETRGKVMKPHIILRFTNFYSKLNDPTWQRADLITEIINDPKRNRMIMRDLSIDLANNPGILMVMTERQEHCEILNYLFNSNGLDSTYIHGGLPTKQKDSIMQELKEGKIKILIATDALLGEGFDCPEITSLFLTTPISFETRLIQVVGRALRYHEGKITPKVYDYQDLFVDVLERAALNRNRLYKKIADNPQDVCRGKKK